MRKLTRLQKILLSIIVLILLFSTIFSILKVSSDEDTGGFSVVTIIKEALIDSPINAVSSWAEDVAASWDATQENKELKKQIDSVASLQAEISELKRDNAKLQEINELNTTMTNYELINSVVTSRDPNYYSNTITIGVGKNQGIEKNLAVITPKGLIGKVSNVYDESSTVKLLTVSDGLNKVSVKIQVSNNTTAEAILERYDYEKGAFVLQLLDTGVSILEGMSVITSGLGGVYPSGLNVGIVSEVVQLSNAVGVTIYVTPSADFDDINYVSVVKRVIE